MASARLRSGVAVTFHDCVFEMWSENRASVYAKFAIAGRGPAPSNSVIEARVQVTHLDRISKLTPLVGVTTPTDEATDWRIERSPSLWTSWEGDEADLDLGFYSKTNVYDPWHPVIRFSPVAVFKFHESVTIEDALKNYVEPLRGVASISTNNASTVTYIELVFTGSERDGLGRIRPAQYFGTGVSQDPFAAQSRLSNKTHARVQYGSDSSSLLVAVQRWRKHSADQHPLFTTYASLQGLAADHPRSRFLLLMQALEGLHGTEQKELNDERKRRFRRERKSVLHDAREAGMSPETLQWLKDALPVRPPTSLSTALRWSVANLHPSIVELLKQEPLVQGLLDEETLDWADALRKVRNNLAHGSGTYPAHQLDDTNRWLERVAQGHVVRLIDGSKDDINAIFKGDG
jgi:hypothetical protein